MSQERSARRRTRRSTEEKQALIAAWRASGLSARAFEEREGVRTSCLWRWKKALSEAKAAPRARPSVTFAPVHVVKDAESKAASSERVIAEVALGHDIRLRVVDGADVEQVARLVRALGGGVTC